MSPRIGAETISGVRTSFVSAARPDNLDGLLLFSVACLGRFLSLGGELTTKDRSHGLME